MCGFGEGIDDMFRYDILGTHVGWFIFRYNGDDLSTCTAHSPEERSHETEDIA